MLAMHRLVVLLMSLTFQNVLCLPTPLPIPQSSSATDISSPSTQQQQRDVKRNELQSDWCNPWFYGYYIPCYVQLLGHMALSIPIIKGVEKLNDVATDFITKQVDKDGRREKWVRIAEGRRQRVYKDVARLGKLLPKSHPLYKSVKICVGGKLMLHRVDNAPNNPFGPEIPFSLNQALKECLTELENSECNIDLPDPLKMHVPKKHGPGNPDRCIEGTLTSSIPAAMDVQSKKTSGRLSMKEKATLGELKRQKTKKMKDGGMMKLEMLEKNAGMTALGLKSQVEKGLTKTELSKVGDGARGMMVQAAASSSIKGGGNIGVGIRRVLRPH
ncbi:MAG: hypothetical protein M1823_002681 [Watsoniomyces obsoletus]|nr:MAG: hypothetical protein M1823_002681 [Watsoniomyces obsoletus]